MSDFVLAGPVWIIRRGAEIGISLGELSGTVFTIRTKRYLGGGEIVPMFTDYDLAYRFLEMLGDEAMSAFQLGSNTQLVQLLDMMPLVTEVALDVEIKSAFVFSKSEFAKILFSQ